MTLGITNSKLGPDVLGEYLPIRKRVGAVHLLFQKERQRLHFLSDWAYACF